MCSHQKQRRLARIAAGTIRAWLTVFASIILFTSTSLPSAAEDGEIRATYEFAFVGLTIAEADVMIALRGNVYTVRVNYRTSRVASMMGSATGEAMSTGGYKKGRLVPATFSFAHQEGQRAQKIMLMMSDGTVDAMTIDPPAKPESTGVPVTVEHLKNITDPLSALLVPAVGTDGKTEIGLCDRTVPVFDGLRRFNVALKKGAPTENGRPDIGPRTTCELRITPIAGEIRSESSSQARAPNRAHGEIALTFAFLNASKIYIPVSFSAEMSHATLTARLTQFSYSGSR